MRQLTRHPASVRTGYGRAASRGGVAGARWGARDLAAVLDDRSDAPSTVRPRAGRLFAPPRVAHRSCLIPKTKKHARIESPIPCNRPNTRFVLTSTGAGEIAGAIPYGAEAPPGFTPAVSLAPAAAAQPPHVGPARERGPRIKTLIDTHRR